LILIQTSASWKKYLRIRGKRLNGALSRRQTNPHTPAATLDPDACSGSRSSWSRARFCLDPVECLSRPCGASDRRSARARRRRKQARKPPAGLGDLIGRRHVTSPLSRKNRQELLLFRTFTAETWVRFALGAAIKTSGYAGHAAVGVIAGTLNITAYRGQWAFAPEL
jgi:hypothetical protein